MFSCNIRRLASDFVDIILVSVVDERDLVSVHYHCGSDSILHDTCRCLKLKCLISKSKVKWL